MYIEELSSEAYVSFYHPRVDFDLRHFLRSSELLIALLDSLTHIHCQSDSSRDDLTLVNMFSGSVVPFKPRPVVLPFGLPSLQEEPSSDDFTPEDSAWVTVPESCVDDWQILV